MIKRLLRRRWRCMLFDGRQWHVTKARQGDAGIEFRFGGTWVTITQEIVYDTGKYLIVAVEPVALADHLALERVRHQIALRALFESGGDVMRYLQIGAVVVPVLAAIYVAVTVSSFQGYATEVSALMNLLKDSPIMQRGR